MRDACLAAMGITQWQLKNTEVAQVYITGLPSDFVFILQDNQPGPLDWSLPEGVLLEKIIQATGKTRESVAIVSVASAQDIAALALPEDAHCVVFGQALVAYIEHPHLIPTQTLTELQNNTDAKRTLWHALKQVIKHHA